MSKLYVAASLWGHAIDEAKKGKPCCIDAETILATQEQIARLRGVVEAKDKVFEMLRDNARNFSWVEVSKIAKAALNKE